jgi:hypothetical protein
VPAFVITPLTGATLLTFVIAEGSVARPLSLASRLPVAVGAPAES